MFFFFAEGLDREKPEDSRVTRKRNKANTTSASNHPDVHSGVLIGSHYLLTDHVLLCHSSVSRIPFLTIQIPFVLPTCFLILNVLRHWTSMNSHRLRVLKSFFQNYYFHNPNRRNIDLYANTWTMKTIQVKRGLVTGMQIQRHETKHKRLANLQQTKLIEIHLN